MLYKVAASHNNTGALADWNSAKPPRCNGIKAGRRLTAGNALVYQDGKQSAVLEFSFMSPTEKDTIEDQLSLNSDTGVVSGFFTVTLPLNKDRTFSNFNCTITLPPEVESTTHDRRKWLPYALVLTDIEEIT